MLDCVWSCVIVLWFHKDQQRRMKEKGGEVTVLDKQAGEVSPLIL